METEKVNPLFKIAIRGSKENAKNIRKFFNIHVARSTEKAIQIPSSYTFEREDLCYFVTTYDDPAISHGHIDNVSNRISRKIITLFEAEKIMRKWEESSRQPKQKRREHKIHKSNCVNRVRFTVTDQLGNTITVCGRYAYEWTINIDKDGMVIQTSFKNRRKALNELERLTGKKIGK